ncbi:MAG: hypothetical protein ACKVRN_06175 [Pyrinomonadaceae bacterium]
MNSLEFTTRIEHGVITLPKDCDEYDNSVARVKVTLEETPKERQARKERLFEAFRALQAADIFRDIKDPSDWQRRLRDEWE